MRRTTTIAVCAFLLAGCASASTPIANRFDAPAAYNWVKRQIAYGNRPAGSPQLYRLAAKLKAAMPHASYEPVRGGLKNIVGTVPGRGSGYIVVGAHYDTKQVPGFVGANDAASGTAVALQLSRTLKPRTIGPTVVFILFDGEESPVGTPDDQFLAKGLRGSKVAVRKYKKAKDMILLDYVGGKNMTLPREGFSNQSLWGGLRSAAQKVGYGSVFPDSTELSIFDDHYPFLQAGVPAVDLIDWSYAPCDDKPCDNLSKISVRSLDATGESVLQLLRTL